jgi:hypothetical protein
MRIEVRKLLARYGYPPDLQRAAVDLVIRQAESLAGVCRSRICDRTAPRCLFSTIVACETWRNFRA